MASPPKTLWAVSWPASQELTANRMVAIDGKTLRGSYDHDGGRAAILNQATKRIMLE